MPITLVTGPANAGKARTVLDGVRRHVAHGLEPLLVVPTRADAEHYLRELAGEGTALGVRVERFAGLIEEIVRRAGPQAPPLGELARTRVLAGAARRAGLPDSSGVLATLADLFAELRVRGVSPARLAQALAAWRVADGLDRAGAAASAAWRVADGLDRAGAAASADSATAAEAPPGSEPRPSGERDALGACYRDYCATLARLGRTDAEQRAVAALDALRERPALWGETPVLLYGFDDLTHLQLDAIETLGRLVDVPVTVSLVYEAGRVAFAGRAASFHALAPLAGERLALPARAEHYAPDARAALTHLERHLFEPDLQRVDPGAAVQLLEGGGERAELELVAAQIATLLDAGVRAREIAVLVRGGPGGADLDLLEEVFAARRIPFALTRRRPFASTAIGRALIGLLRCVPAETHGVGTDEPGQLGDLLAWLRAGAGHSLADRLEVAARRAGVRGAADARALWEGRGWWPLQTLDRLAEAQRRGPAALCERAAGELRRLFATPRRGAAAVLAGDEREEASALALGRRALGELRELARIDRQLAPTSASELARALERLEVVGESGTAPEPEDAVAVLDPLALRARRARAVFVCGLQEGTFPARSRGPAFLSEEERRRLAEVSGLRLGEREHAQDAQLAAERYLLYAAVSRPQEWLFLSWHSADDDGEPCSRSLFVDDVCDLFSERLLSERARRPLGCVDGLSTRAGGDRSLRPPGCVDGLSTRAGGDRSLRPPGCVDGLCARTDGEPTRHRLRETRVLAGLRARPWSPSSLERWIGCPVSWFVERLLRPDAFDPDPEPLARGGLAHAALKDTLARLREQTGSARLTSTTLPRARELLAQALADNEADHPLSVAPERRLAVRRRLHADLERYLEQAASCPAPLEPSALELEFGFDEQGDELPAFELASGVRLRGRLDRVDTGEDGAAIVYDYKGGRAPAGARWIADGNVQVALYMLAVERLMGVRAVGGFYQPLTGEDLRPRGALDADAGLELDCVAGDVLEHEQMRELLERAAGLAREAVAQAVGGELEPRPQTCAFRGGCMFPAICRCER